MPTAPAATATTAPTTWPSTPPGWPGTPAGRPVRLQWTRQQEMANSPMGAAMTVRVEAAVDEHGNLLSWKQEVWSQGHGTRPGRGKTPTLLGAWQTAHPAPVTMAVNQPPNTGGGSDRNATPPYAIPEVHVVNHRVLAMPLRVSALRSLGAHVNVLAAESTIDEIATSLGRDPLEYRLAHLQDERAKAVLQEVARISGWSARRPRMPRKASAAAWPSPATRTPAATAPWWRSWSWKKK